MGRIIHCFWIKFMDSFRIRCSLDGDCSFILHKVSTVPASTSRRRRSMVVFLTSCLNLFSDTQQISKPNAHARPTIHQYIDLSIYWYLHTIYNQVLLPLRTISVLSLLVGDTKLALEFTESCTLIFQSS